MRTLTNKVEQLTSENATLSEFKVNLEADLREKNSKIDTLSYELERTSNELKDLRDTNKGLDTTKYA